MHVDTDLRLIGGGSAGCLAALAAREHSPTVAVTILEKRGDLTRSVSRSPQFLPASDVVPSSSKD